MNKNKKYHIQLAVFEVTKDKFEQETWDWVQEIDLVPPVDSFEEMLFPLVLMYASFDFLEIATIESEEWGTDNVERDAATLKELMTAVRKATMEMFPNRTWEQLIEEIA